MSAWIIAIKIVPKEQKRGELALERTLQAELLKEPLLDAPID